MADAKSYSLALGVGLLVGIFYALLNVRSPARPLVALVGLLRILLGEQIVPLAKRLLGGNPLIVAVVPERCGEHVFGALPAYDEAASTPTSTKNVRS